MTDGVTVATSSKDPGLSIDVSRLVVKAYILVKYSLTVVETTIGAFTR